MQIFDAALLERRATRAARTRTDVPFLWERMTAEIRDRLLDITRDMPVAGEIGPQALIFNDVLRRHKNITATQYIAVKNEIMDVQPYSLDALFSWGMMHWINDLPGFLIQCRHALKPDGVFIGALVGGETLYELRDTLAQTEQALFGGISPRVSPFASLPDMASLMQNAGFALPVIDHDVVTVTYPDLKTLVADIRGSGSGNAVLRQNKKILPKDFWTRAENYYRTHHAVEDGRLKATMEIIYLLGWAPHASQQQAAKRGSATHRLADILKSEEQGTGDFI